MQASTQQAKSGLSNPCVPARLAHGPATIRLYHAAAPTCCWSWGFEAAIHRVRLVYGDQVEIRLVPSAVYQDIDHWMAHNDVTLETWDAWGEKAARKMGIPFWTKFTTAEIPRDATPATTAVLAAFRQGHDKGERFLRGLLFRNVAAGRDVTKPAVLEEAAKEANLDLARFAADLNDASLGDDMAHFEEGLPNVPLGFYNLMLDDDEGRLMVLDFAFDPKKVEEALEFLSRGKLVKNQPDDPVAYGAGTGASHAIEMARAFGWSQERMDARLQELERAGRLRRLPIGKDTYWQAA